MIILARLRGVSLTQPMLINVLFLSRPEGYRELRYKACMGMSKMVPNSELASSRE